MFALRTFTPLVALLALAACSRGAEDTEKPVDPAVSAALAGPLLTEPDLAAMNGAGRALTGTGVASAPIPANLYTKESVAAAKEEAKALAGGTIQPIPMASSNAKAEGGETALISLRRAFGRSPCEIQLGWSAIWAARLPDPLGIYPRGHVEEALGSDAAGCAFRGVTFRTGVAASDVLDFYWARASKAGFKPEHSADGDAHAVRARKGNLSFVLFVKPGPEGLTEVHLLTSGG